MGELYFLPLGTFFYINKGDFYTFLSLCVFIVIINNVQLWSIPLPFIFSLLNYTTTFVSSYLS